MKLDLEQVRHVARLARLEFSEADAERLRGELSAILDAVESLAQVDTSNVPPTTSVAHGAGALRADAVTAHLGAEQALANAPQVQGTSFVIPKVLE